MTHRHVPEPGWHPRLVVPHGVCQAYLTVATVSSVNDNRVLLEERIDRELVERILPLVHPRRVPIVRRGRSVARQFAAATGAVTMGAAVGHDVVPLPG